MSARTSMTEHDQRQEWARTSMRINKWRERSACTYTEGEPMCNTSGGSGNDVGSSTTAAAGTGVAAGTAVA